MRGQEIIIENNIRKLIMDNIIKNTDNFTMLISKNIADIIICRNINEPAIYFIEVKHLSAKNNRIGFGKGDGTGFQPEILKKRPIYFEDHLLWVFQKEGDSRYFILNNNDSQKYISGNYIGVKHNNFKINLFNEIVPYCKDDFIKYIYAWLQGH